MSKRWNSISDYIKEHSFELNDCVEKTIEDLIKKSKLITAKSEIGQSNQKILLRKLFLQKLNWEDK